MVDQKRFINVYQWVERKGKHTMTLFPTRPGTSILKVLKRARNNLSDIAHRAMHPESPSVQAIPLRESQYFTFDRNGELINLDDEAVKALEQKVHDEWREQYLRQMQAEFGEGGNG